MLDKTVKHSALGSIARQGCSLFFSPDPAASSSNFVGEKYENMINSMLFNLPNLFLPRSLPLPVTSDFHWWLHFLQWSDSSISKRKHSQQQCAASAGSILVRHWLPHIWAHVLSPSHGPTNSWHSCITSTFKRVSWANQWVSSNGRTCCNLGGNESFPCWTRRCSPRTCWSWGKQDELDFSLIGLKSLWMSALQWCMDARTCMCVCVCVRACVCVCVCQGRSNEKETGPAEVWNWEGWR